MGNSIVTRNLVGSHKWFVSFDETISFSILEFPWDEVKLIVSQLFTFNEI